ncbi:hypothetical protein DL93DRAFT_2075194, partial [Clavulina sp. PMI_390]
MSLVDTVGSLAVASKGYFMTGVSTDISTSFVRNVGSTGNTIHMTGTVTALGRTLAYTRVDIKDENGKVLAFGSHTKFVANITNDGVGHSYSNAPCDNISLSSIDLC